MSLAQVLNVRSKWLRTSRINVAFRNHHDVEEISQFIGSSENFDYFILNSTPVNEELGRHISDAILRNSHIKTLRFSTDSSGIAIRDMVAWIGSRNTLVNMTSLEYVVVHAYGHMSEWDCSALFPLLLTSTSLLKFHIHFRSIYGCTDDVMSALSSYLGTASLRAFEFSTKRMSEAPFTALCEGVALSTVRHVTLWQYVLQQVTLETGAESLARMIVESSLEEVSIQGYFDEAPTWSESLISALKLTTPVRNMDFAFNHVVDVMHDNRTTRLMINRKWKPLIFSENTPLALWPHILEKSHASPEMSHGSADIVFYVLRQKPDLVPAP